jgi:steroid delta-isomerase-like uncharacterized protein
MSTEDNKALVRRVFDIVNQKNLDAADEVIAADYVYTAPGTPEMRGPEGFKQLIGGYVSAFPDLQMTILDLVAEGDKVVTRWSATGTHRGELMGIAPTGKRATVVGMVMSRCVGGKIAEEVEVFDTLGMLQQLGVVPAPAELVASG